VTELVEAELRHERELRQISIEYERKLTEARDHEMAALAAQHQIAHEREHEFYQEAIAHATQALAAELSIIRGDAARLRDAAPGYMTIERFDREHKTLRDLQATDHLSLAKLLTSIGTLRGLVTIIGLPGIITLIWALLAAANGQTVTGPNGFIP
jgi:hypothetical protein